MTMKKTLVFALGVTLLALSANAGDPTSCPHHAAHMKAKHEHGVDTRGDSAMGFSHLSSTHHFRLRADGGAIEVTANAADDVSSIAAIRRHLRHIATAFSQGDFTLPGVIHDRVPPGVATMKERRSSIRYTFVEGERGGAVRVSTEDEAARRAVHEFLRFQIEDHRTGDPTETAGR